MTKQKPVPEILQCRSNPMRLFCQLHPLGIRGREGMGTGPPEVIGVPDLSCSIFWASQAAAPQNTSAWEEPCLGSLLSPACGHPSRARSSRSVLLPSWAQRTHCSVELGKGVRNKPPTTESALQGASQAILLSSLLSSAQTATTAEPDVSVGCAGCLMHEQSRAHDYFNWITWVRDNIRDP